MQGYKLDLVNLKNKLLPLRLPLHGIDVLMNPIVTSRVVYVVVICVQLR